MAMSTQRSALRLRWPLLVLMASIGLTAIAAFDAQRAVRGQNAVVDRAVREFSSFAAWSYSEHLTQQLSGSAVEVVGAVNHGGNMHTNPHVPAANDLIHYLPNDLECDCHRTRAGPTPAAFFGFKLGTTDVGVAENRYSAPTEGWRALPMADSHMTTDMMVMDRRDPADQWIADTLNYRARAIKRDEHGY